MPEPKLEPAEAARRFAEDPDNIRFMLHDFMNGFGLSPDEMLEELRSGRLVATMDGSEPNTDEATQAAVDRGEVWISGSNALAWLAERRKSGAR